MGFKSRETKTMSKMQKVFWMEANKMIAIKTNKEGKVIAYMGTCRAGDIKRKGIVQASLENTEEK